MYVQSPQELSWVWVLLLLWFPSAHHWFQIPLVFFLLLLLQGSGRCFFLNVPALLSAFGLSVCLRNTRRLSQCSMPLFQVSLTCYVALAGLMVGSREFFCCPGPGSVLGMYLRGHPPSPPHGSWLCLVALVGFVQDNFVPLM